MAAAPGHCRRRRAARRAHGRPPRTARTAAPTCVRTARARTIARASDFYICTVDIEIQFSIGRLSGPGMSSGPIPVPRLSAGMWIFYIVSTFGRFGGGEQLFSVN